MVTNTYSFTTNWSFEATINEVAAILEDIDNLPAWWPAVYLNASVQNPGDQNGIGKKVHLYTKGFLPYTLRWNFVVTQSNSPHGFTIQATGDFVGTGVWTLTTNANNTDVRFDWNIQAEKGLLKHLSFLLKPIFKANHEWAMRQGKISLDLELRRRRGETQVPGPPLATWPHRKAPLSYRMQKPCPKR